MTENRITDSAKQNWSEYRLLPSSPAKKMANRELNIGIVGAGIGGVMCSIAVARAGGKVTVLEAASQMVREPPLSAAMLC